MADEIMQEESPGESDLIGIVEDLRKNSVPREEYEKVVADRKRLFLKFASGESQSDTMPEFRSTTQIREDLTERGKTNLDYARLMVELCDACDREGKPHPFTAPNSSEEDENKAKRVEDLFRDCIESCGGSPEIFTATLASHIQDNPMLKFKR